MGRAVLRMLLLAGRSKGHERHTTYRPSPPILVLFHAGGRACKRPTTRTPSRRCCNEVTHAERATWGSLRLSCVTITRGGEALGNPVGGFPYESVPRPAFGDYEAVGPPPAPIPPAFGIGAGGRAEELKAREWRRPSPDSERPGWRFARSGRVATGPEKKTKKGRPTATG